MRYGKGGPPRDGTWFHAQLGTTDQLVRVHYDADHVSFDTAMSDRIVGAFVDERGDEFSVSDWWPVDLPR